MDMLHVLVDSKQYLDCIVCHVRYPLICSKSVMILKSSSCHFQVILEVAPESLYNELFNKVFKNSLYDLSLDRSANFVIQALISHAKNQEQVF